MVAKILAERNNENCPYDLHYPLKPYQHQVGGHTAVFQIDNNHICKPINESELNFYKTMPDDLREWVPKFCYEIELKSSNLANTYDISISNQNPSCSNYKQGQKQLAECPMITSEGSINPWAIVCQMRSLKSDSSNRRFIALENLCKDYHTPNVLDLKLGIRQYSDNASEEKKLIQKRKCESSTSKQLGMRLCGLQYFDEKTGYNYLDKYAGRSLSVKQLFSLLRHFFQYSNDKVRVNDCLALIDQIEKIRHKIKSTSGLRLFGVSLLIILEGSSDVSEPKPPIARLIDFAHASLDQNNTDPDDGCLMGLDNLCMTIKDILNN